MSHTGVSHVTQTNKCSHTCKASRQCVVVARRKCQKVNAWVNNESCHTHTWVNSYTEMSHVTQKKRHVIHWNVSRHTEINCVTRVYTNESSYTEKYVMSYTSVFFASHVTHRNESWHSQERVMVHTAMSHVTKRNELCYTQQWVMSYTAMNHVTPVSLFHVAIARGQSRDVKRV